MNLEPAVSVSFECQCEMCEHLNVYTRVTRVPKMKRVTQIYAIICMLNSMKEHQTKIRDIIIIIIIPPNQLHTKHNTHVERIIKTFKTSFILWTE